MGTGGVSSSNRPVPPPKPASLGKTQQAQGPAQTGGTGKAQAPAVPPKPSKPLPAVPSDKFNAAAPAQAQSQHKTSLDNVSQDAKQQKPDKSARGKIKTALTPKAQSKQTQIGVGTQEKKTVESGMAGFGTIGKQHQNASGTMQSTTDFVVGAHGQRVKDSDGKTQSVSGTLGMHAASDLRADNKHFSGHTTNTLDVGLHGQAQKTDTAYKHGVGGKADGILGVKVTTDSKGELKNAFAQSDSKVKQALGNFLEGMMVQNKGEVKAGIWGEVQGEISGDLRQGAAKLSAGVEVGAGIKGSNEMILSKKFKLPGGQEARADFKISLDGLAGALAEANGRAEVKLLGFPPTAVVEGKAGAFVGVKAGASVETTITWIKPDSRAPSGKTEVPLAMIGATAMGALGYGAEAHAKVGIENGMLAFDFGAGVTDNVGFEFGIKAGINPLGIGELGFRMAAPAVMKALPEPVKQKLEEMGAKAGEFKAAIGGKIDEGKQLVKDQGHKVADFASQQGHKVADFATQQGHKAMDTTKKVVHEGTDLAKQAGTATKHFVQHPIDTIRGKSH